VEYLPSALTFLFKALEVPSGAVAAAKSIYSLCSSCRQALTSEVPAFLEQYSKLAQTTSLDGIVTERVLEAIACIVQAIPSEEAKLSPLKQLLQFVHADADSCTRLATAGDLENAELTGLKSLNCLRCIAKSLQTPHDVPVDLDAEPSKSTFWTTGRGAVIQEEALTLIRQPIQAMPLSGQIIEAACGVLRAGLAESDAGPFVFPPNIIVDFILHATFKSPRIGAVMSTACAFISSKSQSADEKAEQNLRTLLAWVSSLLQTLDGKYRRSRPCDLRDS
jgi:hypothetical protein